MHSGDSGKRWKSRREAWKKKAEINYLPKKSFRDQKYSYLTQQKNKSFFLEIIPIGEG